MITLGGLALLAVVIHAWPVQSTVAISLLALSLLAWAARHGHRRLRAYRSRAIVPTDIRAYDAMTDRELEYAVGRLCERDGCTAVEQSGGAGDLGADIKANLPRPQGILGWMPSWFRRRERLVIQVKHYKHNVGSEDLQQVGGTARPIHGADVVAVVTTASGFTRAAMEYARHPNINIRLYSRHELARWASGSGPAPWH